LILLALVAVPSAGAALPAGSTAGSPIENPSPSSPTDHFGANMVNAGDVTGDGVDDLLVGVPDSPSGLPGITGKIVYVNGATGAPIGQPIRPPNGDTLLSHAAAPTAFGAQVATIGDLNGDGVPEHVVSAPGSDLSSTAVDMGIVYVYDGATANILKRLELAADDQPSSSPGFGKALTSAVGEPACLGFGGTAPCPDAQSQAVVRGDLDGGGKSDIVIGAPDYAENAANETNPSACPIAGPATCPGLGRIYVFSGENITGAPGTPLVTPTLTVQYPDQATAAQQPHLGASLSPIGDVGSCAYDEATFVPKTSSCLTTTPQIGPSGTADGYPEFLASAPGLSTGDVTGAGKTFVVEGHHALLVAALDSPDPQQDSDFGPPAGHPSAPGNLGASALPDIYLAATGADLAAGANQGRGYAFDGDVTAPDLLARLDDPAPLSDGGFGVFAGLGDLAGADQLNEFALGRLNGGPVTIMSSCAMTPLQTIPDPEPGAHFGASIVPMGDLNHDGYLDLAVGAPDRNGGAGGVYLLTSNGSPGPDFSCNPPVDISVDDVSSSEGDGGQTDFVFTVSLSASSTQPVSVDYQTQDGTATTSDLDYAALSSQTLTFAPGETAKTVTVNVNGDVNLEPNENFELVLSNPVNGSISKSTGVGTILNDDAPPPPGGGGGGGGGGGSGGVLPGGGGSGKPTTGGRKVQSLAKRSISLRTSRSTAKTSQSLQLLGAVRASKNKRSCQVKQKVAIQRRNPDGSWPTVDAAVTKKNGTFVSLLRPAVAQTYFFRAHLKQTKKCASAFSKPAKIKVSN
jgi:hypothetical protein